MCFNNNNRPNDDDDDDNDGYNYNTSEDGNQDSLNNSETDVVVVVVILVVILVVTPVIQEISERKIPVVLCGNKVDRRQEHEGVRKEDGARLAAEHQVLFYETSTRIGTNVKEAMLALAR